MPLSSHVSTTSGQKVLVAEGTRLGFGRGPGVDLIIAAGRGLSRRAGLVTAMAAGVWIANISRTHALYVEGDGYQVRLPRRGQEGGPANGWFVHAGTALVGSRAMLDEGQSLMVTVTGQYEEPAVGRRAGWAEEAALAATGLTGGRPAARGRAAPARGGGGEGPDGVGAAGAGGHTELDDGGRGGTTLTAAALTGAALAAAGQEARNQEARDQAARDRAAGSGAAHPGAAAGEADGPGLAARDGYGTLLPFYLDLMTKLFLVALIWCRPWLDDRT